MSITIRSEAPSDVAAIERLTAEAFLAAPHTSHTEHLIVRELRNAGQLSISLVAEDDGAIVGHLAVSPVSISDGSEGWYGLGPISVVPERQRQGIGGRLMVQALAALRRMEACGCVVVGDPDFSSRFGFKTEAALVLPNVRREHFQALTLLGPVPSGMVSYHEAFSTLG